MRRRQHSNQLQVLVVPSLVLIAADPAQDRLSNFLLGKAASGFSSGYVERWLLFGKRS
jgi:hypothetical protein